VQLKPLYSVRFYYPADWAVELVIDVSEVIWEAPQD
jgi:hypothetical protein